MNKKIVILGGSFNPPTKAHFKLLQSAVDQITTSVADETVKGIFVPSSGAYVSRKMRRISTTNLPVPTGRISEE